MELVGRLAGTHAGRLTMLTHRRAPAVDEDGLASILALSVTHPRRRKLDATVRLIIIET